MLNEAIKIDEKKYRNVLSHKLSNVAKKSPCLLNYIIMSDKVIVRDCFTEKQKEFILNYLEDVKTTIYHIVEWLKNECHPIICNIVREKRMLSKTEVEDYIKQEKYDELDSIILQGGIETEKKYFYRIDRMIIGTYADGRPKDQLFIMDLQTNLLKQYELNMPATLFLKNLREKWTVDEAYNKFVEISKFIKVCN